MAIYIKEWGDLASFAQRSITASRLVVVALAALFLLSMCSYARAQATFPKDGDALAIPWRK